MFRIYKNSDNKFYFTRNNNVAVWNQNHNIFTLDDLNSTRIVHQEINPKIVSINPLLGYNEDEYYVVFTLPYSKLVKFHKFIKHIDIEDLKKVFYLEGKGLEMIYENECLSDELLREHLIEYFY